MSSQRPTARDVADRAGVSVATVSFAFRRPQQVRPATRERVLTAANELGYVPSASARGLRTGRTGAIGLYSFDYLIEQDDVPPARATTVSGDVEGLRSFPLYVDEVQHGIELECRRLGFVLMVGAGGSARHLPAVIDVAGRVDGLIAFAGMAPPEAIALVSQRIPVVELGSRTRWGGARSVWVDNRAAMRELVGHLLTVHGYRRLAFLGNLEVEEFRERYAGFQDALHEAGLAAPEAHPSNSALPADTVATVERLLRGADPPQALVCATDQEALLVVDTLRAAGADVPGRVAVTGFDGILAGRLARPRLTSMAQPMEEIGRTAVRLLLEVLERGDGSGPEQQDDVCLPLALQVGTTCGCTPEPAR